MGILSRSEGLPGFYVWKVAVPVEPYKAYRIEWGPNLREGFSTGQGFVWENLGEEVTSSIVWAKSRPVFAKISYAPAFAPRLLPDEVLQQLGIELEEEIALTPRAEENRFDGSYVGVEDGLEIQIFYGVAYDRMDLNEGQVRLDVGTVRIKEIASGEVIETDVQQLAVLSEQDLPMAIRGAIEFTGPETGTIDFKTIFTDGSEGEFSTVSF